MMGQIILGVVGGMFLLIGLGVIVGVFLAVAGASMLYYVIK